MTDKQKAQIRQLRESGLSYTQISKAMDLSINSIKTYCRRHELGGSVAYDAQRTEVRKCEFCGEEVPQNPGRKKKRFCSDKCRMLWWNKRTNLPERASNKECTCIKCGKTFISNPNKMRKYCSHACYIEHRYGGDY